MFGIKKATADRPLNIIIVGYGKIGKTLIEQLTKEGNNITLIEQREERLSMATNQFDIMGVHGSGASYQTLQSAEINTADLLIAVTKSDELNLLCCTLASTIQPSCSSIARVRSPHYSAEIEYFRDKMGLAMIINPEREAAREISHIINVPSAMHLSSFASGEAEIVRYKLREGGILDGKVLSEFMADKKPPLLFCAVERGGSVMIPNGSFVFAAGDTVTFVSHRADCVRNFAFLGVKTNPVKSCMIVGGGDTAYYLATHLQNVGIRIKIIEKKAARCEELSNLLPHATIIRGDGTDISLLHEEGLAYEDAFVPLTGIDEENILLTLHARNISSAKTITKISRFSFPEVLEELDLDSIVYPRVLAAETIITYVRAKRSSKGSQIESMYHIVDDQAEAIEFNVTESSAITGKMLKDIKLVDNLIIATICRNGRIFFPRGTDTIEVGDSVMVVTTHTGFDDILNILA